MYVPFLYFLRGICNKFLNLIIRVSEWHLLCEKRMVLWLSNVPQNVLC